MKGIARFASALVVAAALAAGGPAAQESAPASQEEYELRQPDDWTKVEYKDGAGVPRVEYVFRDRSDALLKIKRVRVSGGQGPSQLAERDMEQVLRFSPGFVRGKTERVAGGAHEGVMAQYDFVRGGKPMLGRNYYLQGGEGTVWVLQFTGDRATLSELRAVTDRIAREFKQK
jgi:hypothetical protein